MLKYARYERTLENRQKLSKANGGTRNGMFGKTGEMSVLSKAVLQYDLDGNSLNEYVSLKSAAQQLSFVADIISLCCRGKKDKYKILFGNLKNKK